MLISLHTFLFKHPGFPLIPSIPYTFFFLISFSFLKLSLYLSYTFLFLFLQLSLLLSYTFIFLYLTPFSFSILQLSLSLSYTFLFIFLKTFSFTFLHHPLSLASTFLFYFLNHLPFTFLPNFYSRFFPVNSFKLHFLLSLSLFEIFFSDLCFSFCYFFRLSWCVNYDLWMNFALLMCINVCLML